MTEIFYIFLVIIFIKKYIALLYQNILANVNLSEHLFCLVGKEKENVLVYID